MPTIRNSYNISRGDEMYRVFWYQSGTGESCVAGPFATKEEAYAAPMTKLYPPVRSTIQVYKIEEKEHA